MTMPDNNPRAELREAYRKLEAHGLERETFIRHLARQRETEEEIEDRLSKPLAVVEGKLRKAEQAIDQYRARVMEVIVERERYKAQLEALRARCARLERLGGVAALASEGEDVFL